MCYNMITDIMYILSKYNVYIYSVYLDIILKDLNI